MSEERREHRRRDVSLLCEFDWGDNRPQGYVLNLSSGGVLIDTDVIPHIGSRLRVWFTSRDLAFQGTVVRAARYEGQAEKPKGCFALQFDQLTEKHASELGVLIQSWQTRLL